MVKSGVTASFIIHGATYASALYYRDTLHKATDHYVPCHSREELPVDSKEMYRWYLSKYLSRGLPQDKYTFYLCGKWAMITDAMHIIDDRFPDSTVYTEVFY